MNVFVVVETIDAVFRDDRIYAGETFVQFLESRLRRGSGGFLLAGRVLADLGIEVQLKGSGNSPGDFYGILRRG
jgi:hypothetical protein